MFLLVNKQEPGRRLHSSMLMYTCLKEVLFWQEEASGKSIRKVSAKPPVRDWQSKPIEAVY
jgi:hypothetical protein